MLHCGIHPGLTLRRIMKGMRMSDTKKTQAQRDIGTVAARTRREGMDQLNEATGHLHEITDQTQALTQQAADQAREASEAVVDTISRSAEAATDMSEQVADQGRDVLMMGVRAAAGVNGRIVEIGCGCSHRMLESATRAMDIYRDASKSTADRVQALFTSYLTLGRGMQQIQHAWLNRLDHVVEQAAHRPQDLLRCKSVVELAEAQRDIYLGAVNEAFVSSSLLLQLAGRTAQDAMRPLQARS